MRPIKLTLCAFGPFVNRQTVDFKALGKSPLFLINGPTGSGKTTILDAISYALYGKTTGNEREGTQMRCDHAEVEQLTEVIFDFELADKQYRVRRVPEQQRPRIKGEGFTRHKPEAQLYQLDKGQEGTLLVPQKTSEATAKIETLTGLTAEQFRQVVVLPQGQFRQLLLAESQDREQILSRLFETHFYRVVEEQLKEKAKALADEAKKLAQIETTILETVEVMSEQALQEQLATHELTLLQFKNQFDENEKSAQISQKALSDGQQLAASFDRLREAKARLDTIKSKEAQYRSNLEKSEKADAAQQFEASYQEKLSINREQLTAEQAAKESQTAQERAQADLHISQIEWEALNRQKPHLELLSKKIVELKSLLPRIALLKRAEEALQKVEQQSEVKQEEILAQEKALHKIESDFVQEEVRLKKEQAAVALLPVDEARLKSLLEWTNQQQTLEKEKTLLQQSQQSRAALELACKEQEKMAEQAKQTRNEIELAWHRGQAALLAKELEAGIACPVCGSDEHPSPATSEIKLPSESELSRARESAEQAFEEMRRLSSQLDRSIIECELTGHKINELQAQLERTSVQHGQAVEAERTKLEDKVQALREMREQLPLKEAQLKTIETALKNGRDRLLSANRENENLNETRAAKRQDLKNKQLELPEKYRLSNTLEREIKQLSDEHLVLTNSLAESDRQYQQLREKVSHLNAHLTAANERVAQLNRRNEQSEKSWLQNLSASPFNSEEDFIKAKLSSDEREAVNGWIKRYINQKLEAETRLKERAESIKDASMPDLDLLKAQNSEAINRLRAASNDYHQAVAHQKQLQRASEKLNQTSQAREKLDKRYKQIGHLSDIANGYNPHNLSLQRFVLSVLLDDVLIAATQRLKLMSKGRYQLIRKTEVTHRGRKAGLDLDVYDEYTGKTRPVATLSGGESFMAALSLALGLSDVVQGYSGGIQLDMLFIDEGFGSLDSDSLELAIKTLVELQSVGRTVGVISHVSELKERITARIDLIANSAGSSVKLVSPTLVTRTNF